MARAPLVSMVLALAGLLGCSQSDPPGEMCEEPAGGHCCCDGDLLRDISCGSDGRWTCAEGGNYFVGATCSDLRCGMPCSLPCPPDAGVRDGS